MPVSLFRIPPEFVGGATQYKDPYSVAFSHHWLTPSWPIMIVAFGQDRFPASGGQVGRSLDTKLGSVCRGAP